MNVPHVLARRARKDRARKRDRARLLAIEALYIPLRSHLMSERALAKLANFGGPSGLRVNKSSIMYQAMEASLRAGKLLLWVDSEYQPKKTT